MEYPPAPPLALPQVLAAATAPVALAEHPFVVHRRAQTARAAKSQDVNLPAANQPAAVALALAVQLIAALQVAAVQAVYALAAPRVAEVQQASLARLKPAVVQGLAVVQVPAAALAPVAVEPAPDAAGQLTSSGRLAVLGRAAGCGVRQSQRRLVGQRRCQTEHYPQMRRWCPVVQWIGQVCSLRLRRKR